MASHLSKTCTRNPLTAFIRKFQKVKKLKLFSLFVLLLIISVLIYASTAPWSPRHRGHILLGTKTIALSTPWFYSKWPQGWADLSKCSKQCTITKDHHAADAVIFHMWEVYPWMWFHRFSSNRANQVYILYGLESEARALWFTSALNDVFNWTATYRQDSDIVIPYAKLEARDEHEVIKTTTSLNMAAGKSKMAFLLTSHCTTSSRRSEFARELQTFVDIDVFGSCGLPCPGDCSLPTLGRQYKFYLSFENSKCKDYITEKFWSNALQNDMVPVVLGAGKQDYERVAPPSSFIHSDDFESAKYLAAYLKLLDSNDTLYNEYFRWKNQFKVQRDINVICPVCEALHDKAKMSRTKTYHQLGQFWNASSHCLGTGLKDIDNIFDRAKKVLFYILGIY